MISIQHLIDDTALGGVTRYLDTIDHRLGGTIAQSRHVVRARMALPARFDADVVVVHFTACWSKLPYLALLRARRGRRPLVLVEHSYTGAFEALNVAHKSRFRDMLRCAYRLCDRVVAVSYGQAMWMRAAGLVSAQKLMVIPSFTDCEALATLPLPERVSGAPLRIGAYGRYCRQKGFDTLIAAMDMVPPETATLSLRGFGPDGEALKDLARERPHVDVGGQISDLGAFLSSVDVIAMPSRWEAFGQVALEARMAGRPVIAHGIDGLPEQIEPGAGVLTSTDAPADLAAALRQVAAMDTLADMAQAARDSALAHASYSIAQWRTLLDELCVPAPARTRGLVVPQRHSTGSLPADSR